MIETRLQDRQRRAAGSVLREWRRSAAWRVVCCANEGAPEGKRRVRRGEEPPCPPESSRLRNAAPRGIDWNETHVATPGTAPEGNRKGWRGNGTTVATHETRLCIGIASMPALAWSCRGRPSKRYSSKHNSRVKGWSIGALPPPRV